MYEGLSKLSTEILDDATRRGEEIRRSARERADSILESAREAAAAKRQAIVTQAQRDAERHRSQTISVARIEAKNLLLAKREELISRVIELARERLRSSLAAEQRKAALDKLLVEAANSLGGGNLTVHANEQDSGLLTSDFLANVEKRLAASGARSSLRLGSQADIDGGVIVDRDDGRIVCDNSFGARLEQQRWALRNEIWQILTGETG